LPLIRLNEFLPDPDATDWNGDGSLDSGDSWIELMSLAVEGVDLGGWALDDSVGGTRPYTFAPGTLLPPGGFLLRFRSTTHVALNQTGDTVRLLAPNGQEVDTVTYTRAHPDRSYSRTVDGVGDWTEAYPASPGGPNLHPHPNRYREFDTARHAYANRIHDPHGHADAHRRAAADDECYAHRNAAANDHTDSHTTAADPPERVPARPRRHRLERRRQPRLRR
jgi:hypothetical protein